MGRPPLKRWQEDQVVLPLTEFLYTLDQIAYILGIDIKTIPNHVKFLETGKRQGMTALSNESVFQVDPKKNRGSSKHRMRAVYLLPSSLHEKKEWRVPQYELERYLRAHNLRIYERRLARR